MSFKVAQSVETMIEIGRSDGYTSVPKGTRGVTQQDSKSGAVWVSFAGYGVVQVPDVSLRHVVKDEPEVKRVPVNFDYGCINLDFLKRMAMIGSYAAEKYGAWHQYTQARLTGDKSPINHAYEHMRCYVLKEPYDHFDGHYTWHLVAAAYNLTMAYFYDQKFGHESHPLALAPDRCICGGPVTQDNNGVCTNCGKPIKMLGNRP